MKFHAGHLHFDLHQSGIRTCDAAPLVTDDEGGESRGMKVTEASSGAATLSCPALWLLKHEHKLSVSLPAGVTQTADYCLPSTYKKSRAERLRGDTPS